MLLCSIINKLNCAPPNNIYTCCLAYFFYQATNKRINTAIAILRSLIYMLINKQQSLIQYIKKAYNYTSKALFKDANSQVAILEILKNILYDLALEKTYLVINTLNKCQIDLLKLLDFIIQNSLLICIKQLLLSRNKPCIKQKLRLKDPQAQLSLELKENTKEISYAINIYINQKLSYLKSIQDNKDLRD